MYLQRIAVPGSTWGSTHSLLPAQHYYGTYGNEQNLSLEYKCPFGPPAEASSLHPSCVMHQVRLASTVDLLQVHILVKACLHRLLAVGVTAGNGD
jgi:hypothetical protein